jgi:DNA-binding response OmpR family regulator
LRELRAREDDILVLLVTARGETQQRVEGLQIGADDYIVKPFAFSELLARIQAVMRRYRPSSRIQVGSICVDLEKQVATCDGAELACSPKELVLLVALLRAGGSILSRKQLLRAVWGIEHEPDTNILEVHIARIRKRLRSRGGPEIKTVRGKGYYLELPE